MRQARNHGVDDQQQQDDAEAEEEIAEGAGNVLPLQPLVLNPVLIQFAGRNQAVIPAFALVHQLGLRHAPGKTMNGVPSGISRCGNGC